MAALCVLPLSGGGKLPLSWRHGRVCVHSNWGETQMHMASMRIF